MSGEWGKWGGGNFKTPIPENDHQSCHVIENVRPKMSEAQSDCLFDEMTPLPALKQGFPDSARMT